MEGGRAARLIVYSAVGLVVVVAGLLGGFFALNAADEKLSPEAQQLLTPPENPAAPQENLYFALIGLDAPRGVSTIAEGQERIVVLDRIVGLPSRKQQAARDAAMAERSEGIKFSGALEYCKPVVSSCWQGVEARRDEIDGLLKANRLLYRRYLDLHALPAYFDTSKVSMWSPVSHVPPAVRTLFVANTALGVKDARTPRERSAALADLARDIATWRTVLKGEGGLVSKMIAVNHLHGDYALLGDIIGDASVPLAQHGAEIEAMLARLAPQDWIIGAAFPYEFRIGASVLETLERDQGMSPSVDRPTDEKAPWWESYLPASKIHFFKVNATRNLSARHFLEVRRVADAEPRDYSAQRDALQEWRAKHLAPGLGYAYNPIGKILVSVGAAEYEIYALRAHDVAAFQQLVRLAYEARRQGVSAEGMPGFIKRESQWALHPVSGKPFAWDADKRELQMEPLAQAHQDRRFRIPLTFAQ